MRVAFEEARKVLAEKLEKHGVPAWQAEKVGYEMARNSLEGIYTHGLNRFERLVRNIDEGIVIPGTEPELIHSFGAMENYDGRLGLGITNALFSMSRAMELATEHGVGIVALRNTNHWLRAATYGYQAVEGGFAAMCFTNTIPNMPTWGAIDSRIGNNPFMMAFPRRNGSPIIVDSAMSQFSYGALELARLEHRTMPVDAGFDENGRLTKDPDAVIRTKRIIPTGYWKGAAMSFALDIFASALSMGASVAAVGRLDGDEHGVSQFFMAIDYRKISDEDAVDDIVDGAIADLKSSIPSDPARPIIYTGEMTGRIREENLKEGIPADEGVWQRILSL